MFWVIFRDVPGNGMVKIFEDSNYVSTNYEMSLISFKHTGA